MTSDERHDLKRNDLATAATDLPGLWARHGNKVLIVLTVACLAFAAVRYKRSQNAQREAEGQQALANAWAGLSELQRRAAAGTPDFDAVRGRLENDINSAVGQVTDNPQVSPTQAAWAWLARGEMYWAIAHADAAATPTSRPAGGPASADPLALAATAYERVLQNYAGVRQPATIARFALAAVAEERHDVAAARTHYTGVIETPDVSPTDKAMATTRIGRLDRIERPTLLLAASQPSSALPAGVDLMQSLGLPPSLSGPPPTPNAPATRPSASQPAR